MDFFKGEINTGVGELTEEGPRHFNRNPPPATCPGTHHWGTELDFAGKMPYQGEPSESQLPNCETAVAPNGFPPYVILPQYLWFRVNRVVIQGVDSEYEFSVNMVLSQKADPEQYEKIPDDNFHSQASIFVHRDEPFGSYVGWRIVFTRAYPPEGERWLQMEWILRGNVFGNIEGTPLPTLKLRYLIDGVWVDSPDSLIRSQRVTINPAWA